MQFEKVHQNIFLQKKLLKFVKLFT